MNPATDPTPTRTLQIQEYVFTLDWRTNPPNPQHPTLAFKAQADVRLRDDHRVLGWVGYREHATLPLFFATHDDPAATTPDGLYTNDLTAAVRHAAGMQVWTAQPPARAPMFDRIATTTAGQFTVIVGRRVLTDEQVIRLRDEWTAWLSEQPDPNVWGMRWGECFHAFVRARSTAAGWDGPTYTAWLLNVSRYDNGAPTLLDLADQGFSVGQPEPGDEEN